MLGLVSFSRRFRRVIPDFRVKNKTLGSLFDWLGLVFREFVHNRCDLRAAVLSFATVLSLVPVLAVVFTFFDLFGGSEWLTNRLKPFVIQSLAIGVGDKAVGVLDRLFVKVPLGSLGGLGVIFLVISGLTLLNNLDETFNYIWKVTQGRSWFARFRNFWVAVTLVPLLILASLVATSSLHWSATVKALLPSGFYAVISSWLLPLFFEWLGFLLLFMLVPNVRIRWGPAALGALIGSVFWETAKRLLFLYSTIAVTRNVLYGAFIALPLFFLWMDVTFLILLWALEAVYVTQHYKELRRFATGTTEAFSWQSIAVNVLVDTATRQHRGAEPLRINAVAARFEMRTPEFKRLINALVGARLILKPDSDDDFVHLAQDPSDITLGSIFKALGEVPGLGLPESVQAKIQSWQQQSTRGVDHISLKDLAASETGGRA